MKKSWPNMTTELTVGKNTSFMDALMVSVEERVKRLERTRRDGILLTVNKSFDVNFSMILDDIEIIQEDVALGTLTQLMKRRYRFATPTELASGTYDANINTDGGKIEFL